MKKNYTISFLMFVFGLLTSFSALAQTLQAFDDAATVTSTGTTITAVPNVLANDLIDGLPVSLLQVTLSPAASSYLNLDANGAVTVSPFAPQGTYALTYQICVQGQPNNCTYAVVYVTVACPPIDPPHIANIVQPICANPTGYIEIDNVPASGVLTYSINGGALQTIAGTGTVFLPVNGNFGNSYYNLFFSLGACNSAPTNVLVNGIGGIELLMSGNYVDYNANGYTDVGDIISYQYSLINHGCDPITNIQVNAGQFPADGGPLFSLAAGATDSTTFTSTHLLTQTDINNGTVNQSAFVTGTLNGNSVGWQAYLTLTLDVADGIRMVAFVDANTNGIMDGSETNFLLGNFNYEINNDGTVHHLGANLPPTLYESNPLNSYDLSFTIDSNYAPYYSVSNTYNNILVADGSGITTYYFPVIAVPYNDLKVSMFYYQPPRPGFLYTNQLFYTNNGNQTIASGTVTFTKDNILTISSISQAGAVITPTGFTYNFTNLLPNETRYITITMAVPTIPTVALGDLVTNTASVSVPPNDINVGNNTAVLTHTIVGSYDPNEKSESHGGKILVSNFTSNDYLTYTIWFENTGTAEAINVRVNDLLDAQLDETTVRMVNASHQYTLDRVGNNLTWTFSGIDLPPSIPNTTTGHGYLIFQVKPKAGFEAGDIIPNVANIYFDFNPAIVTNVFNTEFVNSLGTADFAFANFRYYPNPVKNMLNILNDTAIEHLSVTSVLGQIVLEKEVQDTKATIDLSRFAKGVYLVKIISKNESRTIRVIKE